MILRSYKLSVQAIYACALSIVLRRGMQHFRCWVLDGVIGTCGYADQYELAPVDGLVDRQLDTYCLTNPTQAVVTLTNAKHSDKDYSFG